MERELKSIKRWIAFGAIGFFLIGLAATIFSISMYKAMDVAAAFENKDPCEKSFDDKADCAFKKGDHEKVLSLAAARLETHPNDVDVHWYRAKVYIQQKKPKEARESLSKVVELAPSWKAEYVEPLLEIVSEQEEM